MKEYDFLRVIGATILAAGVAVITQDPSIRFLPGPPETEATFTDSTLSDSYYRELMVILQRDPAGDKSKQFKGELKKHWVKFTDEDLVEMEGSYDRFKDKLRERYEDRQDEIKQWVADWYKSIRS